MLWTAINFSSVHTYQNFINIAVLFQNGGGATSINIFYILCVCLCNECVEKFD
jgi:hypothetical protein